ncbi:MAG TPA: hypothetical protein VF407_18970 [Polyangiaceae bacterium]
MSRKILVPAGILVFCGAPGVCYGAAVKGSGALHLEIGICGALVLLTGLFLGFLGMARLVRHDAYVAVTNDGLVVHVEGDAFYPWSELRAIVAENEGIGLDREGGRVHVAGTFGDLKPQALADRLEDWRRKSDWSLKPSDPPPR